ncbi:MAG: hypothetical protein C0469_08850 [Cyanobacteria bacterium DS2.3.42]|nr:hypothetical protein [Cyanobacteria bacterium DS2.3.42]
MSKFDDPKRSDDGDEALVIGGALRILNSLESDGVIGKYAIGGSIALLFYVEPFFTEDLDIFCHLPHTGTLFSLASAYERLGSLGYRADGEFIQIEGVLVQFLLPPTPLVEEALDAAIDVQVEGVPTRIFQYEHLLAIMAETHRPRDRAKVAAALDCATPDQEKLHQILARYNLVEKWTKIAT